VNVGPERGIRRFVGWIVLCAGPGLLLAACNEITPPLGFVHWRISGRVVAAQTASPVAAAQITIEIYPPVIAGTAARPEASFDVRTIDDGSFETAHDLTHIGLHHVYVSVAPPAGSNLGGVEEMRTVETFPVSPADTTHVRFRIVLPGT